MNEYDVMDWITDQTTDESIEEVERDELFELIETKDFLAVVFCKPSKTRFHPGLISIIHASLTPPSNTRLGR